MSNNNSSWGTGTLAFLAGAASAIALGGYLLYGPNGKKHRKNVEGWVDDAKEELMDRIKDLKDVSEKTYNSLVEQVVDKYAAAADLTQEEIRRHTKQFKARYNEMRDLVKESAADAEKEVQKADKSAA